MTNINTHEVAVLPILIPMMIITLIVIYIILDFASILNFSRVSGNSYSFKESIFNYYKVIKLMNIKKIDDSFETNSTMNSGYILNSTSYYMKIIDINTVLLLTKSTYQLGYTLLIYKKNENTFQEYKNNITDSPGLFYWYRYYKLDKLIKKTKCRIIKQEEVNNIINENYVVYNRDTKLKELLTNE